MQGTTALVDEPAKVAKIHLSYEKSARKVRDIPLAVTVPHAGSVRILVDAQGFNPS